MVRFLGRGPFRLARKTRAEKGKTGSLGENHGKGEKRKPPPGDRRRFFGRESFPGGEGLLVRGDDDLQVAEGEGGAGMDAAELQVRQAAEEIILRIIDNWVREFEKTEKFRRS